MTDVPPFDDEPENEKAPEPVQPYSLHNLPVLNDEQKAYLDAHWEDPIAELAKKVSGDPAQDGRSFWGIAVKRYIAGLGKVVTTTKKTIKGPVVLTDEQKAFIDGNQKQMKPREMMDLLFADQGKLSTVSGEFRAVWAYVKSLNTDETDIFDEPVESREYKPPMSLGSLVGRVNQFVSNPVDHNRAMFDLAKLKPYEDKNMRSLIGYLRTTRFKNQASSYTKYSDRELFESTFIRLVYDKASEITAGEVDLFIAIASKTISLTRIERSIEGMQERVDAALAGEDDKEGNKTKLSMTLVELINESHTKANQYSTQIKTLIEDLDGKRKDRLDSRNSRNSSILNLFDAWVEEETRHQIVAKGIEEKEEDKAEVNRLKSMSDILGMIAGQTTEEAGA